MTGWATLRTRTPPGVAPRSAAAVGVAVEGDVGPAVVDRLGEEIAAEERVDLQPFSPQGFLDG